MTNNLPSITVAHIGAHSYSQPRGGVDTIIFELSKRLPAHKIKTIFYSRSYLKRFRVSNPLVQERFSFAVRIKYLELLSYAFISSIKEAFSQSDIVHYHTLWAAIFSFIPRIMGKKIVVSCHSLEWGRGWSPHISKIMQFLDNIALLYNGNLISESQEVCNYYGKKGIKVLHIPNGVTIPIIKGKMSGKKQILFFSRLVPEKGAHYLIEAFKKVEKELGDWELIICGQSMYSDAYVKRLRELAGSEKKIMFLGHVLGMEKERAFRNASVFVLPTEIEGMSLSLLEAIGYGIPVIVSDINENRAVVGSYGFYFKSKSVNSLSSALKYVANNESEAERIASLALSSLSKTYDWEVIAESYDDLYRSLFRKNE
jgi:glycosyltransferase involved in cell wall biosynthesis